MMGSVRLVTAIAWFCVPITTGSQHNLLHIGAFYPLTGSFSSWGRGCLPAAILAQEHINNRTDILEGYKINLVNVDTQGSPGVTTRELFSMLHTGPPKAALLGPYLSHTAVAVAQTARWWHLLQVAPTPFTPSLSNRKLYPYVFRIRAALTTFNPARVSLVRSFGWRRVAILTRQTDYFLQTTDMLFHDLTAANISVVTSEVYQTEGEPHEELLRIKKLNARIIFVFAYDEYARKIFCQIYKMGMYGPRYVWILHYSNDPYWMNKPTDDGLCSSEQLRQAADGHLVTRDVTLREDNSIPLAGMTTEEFIGAYTEKAREMSIEPSTFYAPIVYDALWTLALAFNSSVSEQLGNISQNKTDLRANLTQRLMDSMEHMTFEGMTGEVRFSKFGEIATLKTKMMRNTDGAYKTLGFHDALNDNLTWVKQVRWKGGRVPFDNVQVTSERYYLPDSAFYVMVTLSVSGILLALGFLWYNVKHRHEKVIRMSSPNLNNLIALGGILTYCSVIAGCCSARPLTDPWILTAVYTRYTTLLIGYSLGFGALFAKTWRVFKIFTSKTAKKVSISDTRLLTIVSGFVCVDVVFMLFWFVINPLYLVSEQGVAMESVVDTDFIIVPWVRISTSKNADIWHLVVYTYKGLALVFGAFLAFQTRGVSIPALNDSRFIGIAIYNVVTISILAMLTSMLLDSLMVTLTSLITGISIITASTVTQCTVFLPKVFRVASAVAPVGTGTQQPRSTDILPRDQQLSSRSHFNSMDPQTVCQICQRQIRSEKSAATVDLPSAVSVASVKPATDS